MSASGRRTKRHWIGNYADLPPALDLPTDRPRGAVLGYRGERCAITLTATQSSSLVRYASRNGCTPFMVLYAAYAMTLHRSADQADLVIGVPASVRPLGEEWEPMVGFCINMLPVRSRVSGDVTLHEHVISLRRQLLDAYEHRSYLLADLIREINPERDSSRAALVQTSFNFEKLEAPDFGDVNAELLLAPVPYTKYELSVNVLERDEALELILDFNTELFDRSTANRLLGRMTTLLDTLFEAPDTPLARASLLSREERDALETWNRTELPFDGAVSLHASFERQTRVDGEAIAVSSSSGSLTYAELDGRAEELSNRLRRSGVRDGERVAVCLPRTPDLLAALLAVLKCGAVYVPLDPTYPTEHIEFVLIDSKASALVSDSDIWDGMPVTNVPLLLLDDDVTNSAHSPARPMEDDPGPPEGAAAYVIYTSGSTGVPKGVVVTHRNAIAMLAWARQTFEASALDCVLASTSVCFDLSVYELFLPLSVGGEVALAPNALHLREHPAAERVTLVNTVPSVMGELLATDGLPASVDVVNLAGEPLKRALLEALFEGSGVRSVFNLYGPSECTTYSTAARFDRGEEGMVHIGRPIANTHVYVLDDSMSLLPVGVRGELYIGGEGVAQGYLGRRALTAERFVPDPFVDRAGARMYRTGDLARFRADGNLDFLGRVDFQIKLRGYRIEPGEIESALTSFASVDDAVVTSHEPPGLSPTLIAHVASRREAGVANLAEQLETMLRRRLPRYMLPSAIVVLERMPLTPNGKIDRGALPAPCARECGRLPGRHPDGATENLIARLWAEALEVETVGADDDFFELGGDSFRATRLLRAMNEVLAVSFTFSDLVNTSSVAGLAALATERLAETGLEQMLERMKGLDERELEQLLTEAG